MTAAVMLLLLSAPAPRVKPPPPPPAIPAPCSCIMTWRGTDCETHFREDGVYACLWAGRWWEGRWRQEKGTLAVEEWPCDNPGSVGKWEVRLSAADAGRMGDADWRIRPLAGRVD